MEKEYSQYQALHDSLDDSDSDDVLLLESERRDHSLTTIQLLKRPLVLFFAGIIVLQAFGLVILGLKLNNGEYVDPSIGLWSPAQDAVSYTNVEFGRYFENRSPYTSNPTPELEKSWEDLYNFGISGIDKDEASQLYEPTAHLPHDDGTYVISLGVFHQLHCVNHLRKALYPDEYPGLWEYNPDGTVKRDAILALHWDHCIDILRQTLMCHADITPMPYFYRESDDNVYSELASTQTCRDFGKIKRWALDRQIHHWRWNETGTEQIVGKEEVEIHLSRS